MHQRAEINNSALPYKIAIIYHQHDLFSYII